MQSEKWILGMFVLVASLFVFNLFLGVQATNKLSPIAVAPVTANAALVTKSASVTASQASAGSAGPSAEEVASFAEKIIPKGTPEIYGKELGVSFDKPVESLKILEKLDADMVTVVYDEWLKNGDITQEKYGQIVSQYKNGIKVTSLSPQQKERYIKVASLTACEYCCGSKTLVTKDGMPACQCAHSAAMRGIIKYLLTKHPELSDDQTLKIANDWKTMSFPRQSVEAALKAAGKLGTPVASRNNSPSGNNAPAGRSSPSGNSSSPGPLGNLPSQVGGC